MEARLEMCAALLRALDDRAPPMTPAQLDQALAGWQLVDVGGAVVMIRGAEMHVGAVPEARGRWACNAITRQLIRRTFDRFGRVETFVMKDHKPGHAFVRRLGFIPFGECGAAIRYELRTLRHA